MITDTWLPGRLSSLQAVENVQITESDTLSAWNPSSLSHLEQHSGRASLTNVQGHHLVHKDINVFTRNSRPG